MIRWAVIVLIGCAAQEPPTVTRKNLVGAYEVAYAPAEGDPIHFERDRVVFNSPTTTPECCFGIWRRSETTLELGIGNRSADSQACTPLMHIRIYVEGVLAAAAQMIDLSPANTRAYVYYSEPTQAPCPRALDPGGLRAAGIELWGKLQLPVLHCEDEPNELGCALIAKGAWDVRSVDGNFAGSGWFEANDTLAPLSF